MNKKIIALIVVVVVLVIAGVVIYAFTGNGNNTNTFHNETNSTETNTIQDNSETEDNEDTIENNTTDDGSNILVLYFSMSGNTETIARMIHNEVGGDLVKLETVQTYPEDYNELVDYAQEEQREDARPQLATVIDNIDQYDMIFLGYPNWWGDMPMPIYTFLDTYDLSGKTIAPFITHGGSGLSGTPNRIRNEEPNATVTEGLSIYGSRAASSEDEVLEWLNSLGL